MSKLASELGASTLSKSSVWQMWTSEAAARQPGAAGSRELAWARPGLSPAVGDCGGSTWETVISWRAIEMDVQTEAVMERF